MAAFPLPKPPGRRIQCPRSLYDCLGMTFFIFGGLFLLWYEVFYILPKYYPHQSLFQSPPENLNRRTIQRQARLQTEWQELLCHYFMAIFFAVNIYGNMYKIITTDTSKNRFMYLSGSLLPEGWRYCSICDRNLPPRSHHCKLCDTCILKRDHHCWFTGCCIGYYNHRYYVAMVVHMVFAALYCNIFNLSFVVSVKGHLKLYTFLSYLAPPFGLIFGYYNLYVFLITTLTSIGTALLFMFSWLLYIQICQIISGQTKFETKKQIKKYNLGVFHTVKEVLGQRWYLVFLFPWIPSPLPGSGNKFKEKRN